MWCMIFKKKYYTYNETSLLCLERNKKYPYEMQNVRTEDGSMCFVWYE